MTAHGASGHRKTTVEDQMTIARVVNTSSLPPRAKKSVSPTNTVSLQVVQENNRDIQKFQAILSDQHAPPTHANFRSHFFKKNYKNKNFRNCKRNHLQNILWQHRHSNFSTNNSARRVYDGHNPDTAWRYHAGTPGVQKDALKRYYCPSSAEKVQALLNTCQFCKIIETDG